MRVKHDNLLLVDETLIGPVDMSASFNLQAIYLGHIAQYAIQLVFTGTPSGNFKLQASNDQGHPQAVTASEREAGIVNWTDVADSAVTVSASGDIMWNAENVGYLWVRVVYTSTGAGGELTSAKQFVKGI